jgi:Transposase IS4
LELTVDKTMVFWVGVAEGKLMFIPRKPTPLGFMLKTIVDTESGILVNAEIVEGAEEDASKEYNEQWGKSTGCTLRLTKPWHGKSRIIIGDSWFGSYRCAVALLKHGCFTVANVKTGHKHFPKKVLKGLVKKRGDTHHMKIIVPGMENEATNEVYGSIHLDA